MRRTPPPDLPADAPRVVFLGDSLSAGLNVQPTEAFPAVLQRLMAEHGRPFHLLNAGVSGSTTGAALERVAWVLKKPADIVVVQLGANDGFRGLSLEDTEKNLRTILQRIQEAKAQPVLLGMKLPPNYGAEYAADFEALFKRLASETKATYVTFFLDGVAGVAKLNLADGIHPNPEGHQRIALNLAPHLLRALAALEQSPSTSKALEDLREGRSKALEIDENGLAFLNTVGGRLEIELTQPAKPISPQVANLAAPPSARVRSLKFKAELFIDNQFRELNEEEWKRPVFRGPRLFLRGSANVVVVHDAPDGKSFSVRDVIEAVIATARETRDQSKWFGGVNVHHIFFEGIQLEEDGVWDIHWGS